MIELCNKYLFLKSRVNLYYVIAWMSRNSLLESDMIYLSQVNAASLKLTNI